MKLEIEGVAIEVTLDSDGFPCIAIKTDNYLGDYNRPIIQVTLNGVYIHKSVDESDYDTWHSEGIRQSYDNCKCPDCEEDIPFDVRDGDGCSNCSHVFYHPQYAQETVECLESLRRDEKHGLYPQHENASN